MSPKQNGTYYLGRVIKLGVLDHEKVMAAIEMPRPITAWGFDWTFIKTKRKTLNNTEYIYSKLCKYSPNAEVTVIDPDKSEEIKKDEPNLHMKEYLEMRSTDKMKIEEESGGDSSISTNPPELVKRASEQTKEKPFKPPNRVDIGDAAILMAADGYGTGFVKGRQKGEIVVIKTSETIKNFTFAKDAEPDDLFRKAYEILSKIKDDRHMEHGKK